jgi:anti-anti-sigma factor
MVSLDNGEVSPNRNEQQSGAQSSPVQLQILIGERELTPILQLAGEVDMASVPLLHETYGEVCGESGSGLIIDLSGVTFLDSSGLAILISIHEELEARGAQLTILAPTPPVRRLFGLTGLDSVFEIEPLEREDPGPLG